MLEYPDKTIYKWQSIKKSPFFSRHLMCLRACPPPTLV